MVVCAHRVRWTALTGAASVCNTPTRGRAHTTPTRAAHTRAPCTGAFRNRSLFYLCEGVVSPRIAGTLGARNLEAGVVSLIVMKLISVLKFRNRYFEITLFFIGKIATSDLSCRIFVSESTLIVINIGILEGRISFWKRRCSFVLAVEVREVVVSKLTTTGEAAAKRANTKHMFGGLARYQRPW